MNSKMIHNLLNIAIALVAALAVFDWTVLFSHSTAMVIVGIRNARYRVPARRSQSAA